MKNSRILSYDGLKGLAIISVIAYHLFPSWIPGGFLFVNTFLVVGGFFFARSFEKLQYGYDNIQWEKVRQYFKKTIQRLFVPLFWLILIIVIGLFIINPVQLKFIRGDILSGLFFVNNIFQILGDRSYFVQMTNASPFTHLWYNSIHLQSVIISMGIMLLLQRFKLKAPSKGIFWLMIVLISHLSIIFLYKPGQDPSRVYYGIESRYASFALGIAAAYVIPSILNLFYNARFKRFFYNLIALTALFATVYLVLNVKDQDSETYLLWMSVFNLLSFFLVFSITLGSPIVTKIFSLKPLAHIGKRSYSFYLWYYPIIVFFLGQYRHLGENMNLVIGLSILAIFLIGEIFYTWIEQDKLDIWFATHFDYQDDVNEIGQIIEDRNVFNVKVLKFIGFITLMIVFVRAVLYSDNNKSFAQFELEYQMYQAAPKIQSAPHPLELPLIEARQDIAFIDRTFDTLLDTDLKVEDPVKALYDNYFEAQVDTAEIRQLIADNEETFEYLAEINPVVYDELTPHELLFATQVPLTFFGDSLVFISAPYFTNVFWQANHWGQGSLQIWDALPILEDLINEGFVKENLVVILGTNAGLDQEAMDELMSIAGEDRKVFFVNTNSRVFHIDNVNNTIKDTVKKYDNAYEIDWYSHQKGNPDWYQADEIHYNREGEDQFIILATRKLYEVLGADYLLDQVQ